MGSETAHGDVAVVEAGSADVDVVVVGAGMAGLYLLKRLEEMGLSARAFESGDDVGGTWYWNRYPGARCDVASIDYQYTFDPELEREWEWSERYAPQPEILRYLGHVADKYDLRRHVTFSTRIERATWDDDGNRWRIRTDDGDEVTSRWYVMATGCLSAPKDIDIPGADRFAGPTYSTSRWPHDGVDFTGRRVAVIGTGSSAIQSIPLIAAEASELTVFQRTPNFSIPARNGPPPPDALAEVAADRDAYREAARWSGAGVPRDMPELSALQVSDEELQARLEAAWEEATIFSLLGSFNDVLISPEANEKVADFVRSKIREVVDDPDTAEALCPKDYPIGTKRLCLDTSYYETFNLPHVQLVDLRREPIATITETGIDTTERSFELDDVVFATGFDAMTGALVAVDSEGRVGAALKEAWADGPRTYLGLMTVGFPNLFMVTGPQSPSVLSNMAVSIEQHVDWICDTLERMRSDDRDTIEPTPTAQAGWVQHTNDFADITLFPRANSWYMGANVPGKPRVVLPYLGGVDRYRGICEEVVERGDLGFRLAGPGGERCNDGVVRSLQPDVLVMLETMAEMDLPPIETLGPDEARAFSAAAAELRPPGPDVGEVVDGKLPGAEGALAYRLYRPASEEPHPVVVYFHGGGWVLGSTDSDDPFCRDLCVRTDAVVVSVDYRHAPEARFPAAHDDAWAALRWVADHADELGGLPGRLAVAGWSAGANLAAHVAQRARDEGGPDLAGQLLVTPVTDCDTTRRSYAHNGDGYLLTADLMRWFWDHYADPADRTDPRVSVIRAASLAGLPPAAVFTCDFDPLRDEGDAYAAALADAGVEVHHQRCRGHIHTSLMAVDALPTGEEHRAAMAAAVRGWFS